MDLLAIWHLDPMKAIKLRKKCVGVVLNVVEVVPENFPQEFMLRMMNRLDDIFVISGKVKETAALARRAELGKYIFPSQGHKVVGGVETEQGTQMSEHPRSIVLKLEIIFGRRDQFVAGAMERISTTFVLCSRRSVAYQLTCRTSTFALLQSRHP